MKTKQTKTSGLEEIREHLKTATDELDVLIEHFAHPSYNPAQVGVMRRIREHIIAAAELNESQAPAGERM